MPAGPELYQQQRVPGVEQRYSQSRRARSQLIQALPIPLPKPSDDISRKLPYQPDVQQMSGGRDQLVAQEMRDDIVVNEPGNLRYAPCQQEPPWAIGRGYIFPIDPLQ